MERMLSRSRPLGVTIIAVLLIIAGILELVGGGLAIAVVLALGHTIAQHGHGATGAVVDAAGGVLGGISIVIGILTLIFAWGLWTLKSWAFWLTVVFAHTNGTHFAHEKGLSVIFGELRLPAVRSRDLNES